MEAYKVSVIVPVYNAEKYIRRCVGTLTGQTYKNLEILLVDDGSRDDSGGICDDLAKEDERIRVIHKENGGLVSAQELVPVYLRPPQALTLRERQKLDASN